MAVPKKKHSKSRTRVRHTAWKDKHQKRLLNGAKIVACQNCNEIIPERTVCHKCGTYKGNQIFKKSLEKNDVTVVKA